MDNVFMPYSPRHCQFSFGRLGNVERARETLGPDVPVLVYRLMLDTMAGTLAGSHGQSQARQALLEAGRLAGHEFVMYRLLLEDPPDTFFAAMAGLLREMRFGALEVERYDHATGEVAFAMACTAAPAPADENATHTCFEPGFLTGVMEAYTGKPYSLLESLPPAPDGARRFTGKPA